MLFIDLQSVSFFSSQTHLRPLLPLTLPWLILQWIRIEVRNKKRSDKCFVRFSSVQFNDNIIQYIPISLNQSLTFNLSFLLLHSLFLTLSFTLIFLPLRLFSFLFQSEYFLFYSYRSLCFYTS